MTERTRAPSSAAAPGLVGREAAIAALDGFYRLLERVSQYPPGHPVVQQAQDRTRDLLESYLRAAGTVHVEAGRNVLRLGSRRLDALSCRLLGTALAELDIVRLEIRRGVQGEELLELAQRLARLRASGGAAAARAEIGELVEGKASEHVVLGLLDYNALPIDEGAMEIVEETPEDDDKPERIWNALNQSILGDDGHPTTLAPEQLAGLLGEEIVQEGAGPDVLSGQLQRLMEDVETLDPEARRQAQARIGRFLSALPRALREELLRIDPSLSRTQPLRPDSLVTALLLGAVQGVDRPPEDAVALLNQLLRSTSDDEGGLQDLLERVSAGEASPDELDRLGSAVSEIFRRREDIQANPDDYQALIDSLARAGVKAVASPDPWKDRFGDPRDVDGNRAHVVRIAAEQLRDPAGAAHALRVVQFMHDSVDGLLHSAHVGALQAAVSAAADFAQSGGEGHDAREAAGALVAEAIQPSRLARVLEVAVADHDSIDAALDLARRAGREGADVIFPMLGGAPRRLAEGLHDILVDLPPEMVLARVRGRAEATWTELRPVFPVLRRLQGKAVEDFLFGLLQHPDENVRSNALDALGEEALKGEHASDLLFALLQDPSPRIVRGAVRKLGALEGDDAVDLLADFVGGRLMRSAPSPWLEHRLYAVRILTLRGAAGWERLKRCLGRLSWRMASDDVDTAHAIASVLERRSGDPGADRALRRWRWSPARRLGGLFRKGRKKVQW